MKACKTPFLALAFFLIVCSSVFGQQIKFNQTNKIKHVCFQYLIGKDGSKNFVLGCNFDLMLSPTHTAYGYPTEAYFEKPKAKLLIYDDKFNEPQEMDLDFKHASQGIVAVYLNEEKNIVIVHYSGEKKAGYFQDVFNQSGASISSKIIAEHKEKGLFGEGTSFVCSQNHLWYFFREGDHIRLINKDFEKVWEKNLENSNTDYHVLNNGTVLFKHYEKSKSDDAKSFIVYNTEGEKKEVELGPNSTYKIDEANNKLYVVSQNGEPAKFLSAFKAKEFNFYVYDLLNMELKKKEQIPFSDEVLLKATNSKHIDRVKGIPNLRLQNVITKESGPVVVFESFYITSSTSGHSTTYYANFEDVVVVEVHSDGSTSQKVIERDAHTTTSASAISGMLTIYQGGKLYVLFNSRYKSKFKLECYSFGNNLENEVHKSYETLDDHDNYYYCYAAQKYSKESCIIFGSRHAHTGSAFLIFGEDKEN